MRCSKLQGMAEVDFPAADHAPESQSTREAAQAVQALAKQAVELLFEQEGVPDRRRSKKMAEVLGMSYHAAHRRMTGETPWSLEDLQVVASSFGRSLPDLFQPLHDKKALPAMFVAGTFHSPCRLWLGSSVDSASAPARLVAWQDGDLWMVGTASTAPKAAKHMTQVASVLLQPRVSDQPRVAVLDDDEGYTKVFKQALVALGYDVDAFNQPHPLLEVARERRYDAYVVDWILGDEGTAASLCNSLRELDPEALLILQSGQLAGADVENDLLRTAMHLDMEPVVKPVRPSFLAAKIQRHLGQKWQAEFRRAGTKAEGPGA